MTLRIKKDSASCSDILHPSPDANYPVVEGKLSRSRKQTTPEETADHYVVKHVKGGGEANFGHAFMPRQAMNKSKSTGFQSKYPLRIPFALLIFANKYLIVLKT